MTDDRSPPAKSILIVGTDLSTGGGVNRVIRDLAVLFDERLEADVTVLSGRSTSKPTYPLPPSVRVEFGRGPGLIAYVRSLFSARRRKPDIAIGMWTQDNILLLLVFAFSRTRVVVCEHDSHFSVAAYVRLLRRLFYPRASCVTVLNRAELAHYSRFLSNVRLVPNPVSRPASGTGESERLVIGVGHLIPRKGFADLLEAWERSGLGEAGWRLAIIGDGPQRAKLEVRARALQGAELVPPTDCMAQWYDRASIIAVTSDREVFSLVLAEAALGGAIPLAYAADGPAYLLEEFPALLVPVGDVAAFAERLRKLALADREPLKKQVRAALEAKLSPAKIVEGWREIIETPAAGR